VPEFVSKSEFARRMGVKPAAVTNWISRRRLTRPALRADGRVDFERGRAQIRGTVDPMLSASAHTRVDRLSKSPSAEETSARGRASDQLLQARAISASVDAMGKRREFLHESGRYMLAADVEAAWTRSLTQLIATIEQSFPDLAADLGLDREQQMGVRRWWRNVRMRAAEEARAAANGEPAVIVDPGA
jgi:hypothetical protein